MQQAAAQWLEALPVSCPAELLKSFDEPVCRLAQYWIQAENIGIYMKDKQKPDPDLEPGSIRAIPAFSHLGTRSLLGR